MPKNRAADASHGVFTDHSIPRIPGGVRNQSAASWRLRGFGPADRGERELGLAYAEIGVRTGDKNQQAEALYESALREDADSVVAMLNLGRLYGSSGLLDDAIRLWREALKRDPRLAEAGANLQIALRAKKDNGGAEKVRRGQQFCSF